MMDVIVVGCGASGVMALRTLHDAGLKALGLEAADRIGGRICTVPFGDGVVDMGAAWCHGEEFNLVFKYAEPLGLLGRPEPDKKFFVLSNGDLVANAAGEDILKALREEVENADKKNNKSISECVRNAATSNQTLVKNPQLTKSFVEWYERSNHVGGKDDPRKGKSLRGLIERWPCKGEFLLNWKGKGYKTLLDILQNKNREDEEISLEIHLNKEVESIRWRTNEPEDQGNPLVQVKCKDGSLYTAKSVLVTVSLGVLKEKHKQLFNPPLPAEKVNVINNLQFSVLAKIYIEFDKPWWPKTPANFTLLWREEDKAKFAGDQRWITEVFGLQTVEYQPNLLLAFIYGNGAEDMENVSLEGVRDGVEKILDIFRQKFAVTPIKNILRSQWASNPLIRGAYAYRSVANEEDGGSAIVFNEPLCHDGFPVVCFAGEAASHHRHGDVHGALDAGFMEAKRLIESFKEVK